MFLNLFTKPKWPSVCLRCTNRLEQNIIFLFLRKFNAEGIFCQIRIESTEPKIYFFYN